MTENLRASSITFFIISSGRLLEVLADHVEQARVAELFVVRADDLEDTVGEKQQRVAFGERTFFRMVFEVSDESQRRAGFRTVIAQSFNEAFTSPQMQRPGMTGIRVGDLPFVQIDDQIADGGEKHRSGMAFVAFPAALNTEKMVVLTGFGFLFAGVHGAGLRIFWESSRSPLRDIRGGIRGLKHAYEHPAR